MGWAARARWNGRPNRAWGERGNGIRVVACVNCGEYVGTLIRAFMQGGRQFYVHDFKSWHPVNKRCRVRFKERVDAEGIVERAKRLEGASRAVDPESHPEAAVGDRSVDGDVERRSGEAGQ